ncbi:MAG: membrane integrity-associated transporter subunit PqiC [Desulfobacter sp.]|nr:membrane integrity-associated transporter subunit PqiC [Desulfobacter sp.]
MNRPINQIILALFAALLAFLFSGCSIKNDFPQKERFRLTAASKQAEAQAPETGESLWVKSLDISPEFETSSFSYRIGKNRFSSDFYHVYMIPPARMVTEQIKEDLYASRFFSPPSQNAMDEIQYHLRGKIIDLYADFQDDQDPKAMVTIRLFLEHNEKEGFKPVITQTYRAVIPMTESAPEAFVKGLSQGLTQILNQFFQDMTDAGIQAEKDSIK